jgi:exosortase/archaeosortase family protein
LTFNDLLASVAVATGFDKAVSTLAPYEATAVADLLRGLGLSAGSTANNVWLGTGFVPIAALIDWNCVGWQGFFLFGLTSAVGIGGVRTRTAKLAVVLLGLGGVFAINVVRIFSVVLIGYYVGYPTALIFHDYGGAILTLTWLLGFWMFVLRRESINDFESQVADS